MIFKDINKRFTDKTNVHNSVNKALNYGNMNRVMMSDFGFKFNNSLQSYSALINAFSSTPDVYGVIGYLANAKSKIKVKMINSKGDEITKHPILDIIQKPNYFQSRSEFLKQHFAREYVLGNAFVNIYELIGFKPEQMFSLPPESVQIITQNDAQNTDFRTNKVTGYHFISSPTKSSIIDAKNVIHFNKVNLDTCNGNYLMGMSPLLSSKMPINSLISAYEAQLSIYQRRGAMGVLTPKNTEMPMIEKDKQRILDEYYSNYGLGNSQSSIMISPTAVDYIQMGLPISELQLNETNVSNFEAVCIALNINASLLRNTGASTRDNILMFEKQLWSNNLVPEINDFWEAVEIQFKKYWNEDFKLVPDYSVIEVLRKDDKTLAETNRTEIMGGFKTPNQVIVENGGVPSSLPEMDMYYMQSNLVAVGQKPQNQ